MNRAISGVCKDNLTASHNSQSPTASLQPLVTNRYRQKLPTEQGWEGTGRLSSYITS